MLLANEVVALEIKRRGRPGIYRIHENPGPGAAGGIPRAGQVDGLSLRRPDEDAAKSRSCWTASRGKPGEDAIKIGLLKSLKRAIYSPKPLGHFGLSKINYTHFTSPIRRYSDLVVHRILFCSDATAG